MYVILQVQDEFYKGRVLFYRSGMTFYKSGMLFYRSGMHFTGLDFVFARQGFHFPKRPSDFTCRGLFSSIRGMSFHRYAVSCSRKGEILYTPIARCSLPLEGATAYTCHAHILTVSRVSGGDRRKIRGQSSQTSQRLFADRANGGDASNRRVVGLIGRCCVKRRLRAQHTFCIVNDGSEEEEQSLREFLVSLLRAVR